MMIQPVCLARTSVSAKTTIQRKRDNAMITLNKCDYCDILLKKMQVLLTDFENSLYRFGMTGCKGCPYDNKECLKFLQQDYFETLSFFGQVPDESKMKCSVCQYLPKTVFGLLDKACGVKDEQELNRINLKFQFYNFIYIICEELFNSCRRYICFLRNYFKRNEPIS